MRSGLLVLVVVIAGCARDVRVTYPAEPDEPTGTLVLLMSQAASDVNVAIDGTLVVSDAHTSRIEITHVPGGTADIVITANGADKEMHVWVGADHTTTIPLGVPDASMGLVKTIVGTVVSLLAYSLLR